MDWPKRCLKPRKHLFAHVKGESISTERGVTIRKIVRDRERVLVVGPQACDVKRAGRFKVLHCQAIFSEVVKRQSQGLPQAGFNQRLVMETRSNVWHSRFDGLTKRYVAAQTPRLSLGSRG